MKYHFLRTYREFKKKVMANGFQPRLKIDKLNSFILNSLLILSDNLVPNIKTDVYLYLGEIIRSIFLNTVSINHKLVYIMQLLGVTF